MPIFSHPVYSEVNNFRWPDS